MKKDFPIFNKNKIIFFDNASTTHKPYDVINSIVEYYTQYNANIYRGIYKLSEESTKQYEESRNLIAQFIGSTNKEIIFVSGTTYAINFISRILKFKKNDEIIITEMEHNSNVVPWINLCKKKKLILKIVPLLKDGSLNINILKKFLNKKTKFFSLTHASNVLGIKNPIKDIINTVKNFNKDILCLIDGSQAISNMKINVKKINCDFYTFSSHKMYGPTGIGVLFVKKDIIKNFDVYYSGGGITEKIEDNNNVKYVEYPQKFEPGTPHISGVIGLSSAIKYIKKIGMDIIEKKNVYLKKYLLDSMSSIKNINIINKHINNIPIVSFNINGIHPHDVSSLLNKYNICIRSGHHCAILLQKRFDYDAINRISLSSMYNSTEEIDYFINIIKKIKRIFHA